MASNFFRKLLSLELEEKILNIGAFLSLIGVFFPWIGGQTLGGQDSSHSGFGFYTSFIGIVIFGLQLFVLLITVIPLTGGPILVRRRHREAVRFMATSQAIILILASLSVLIKVTLEFSRMEIRFGIYVSLIGGLVAMLYSFLRFQEQRRNEVQELFHHPEEQSKSVDKQEYFEAPAKPPPPPPPPVEEHRMYR
ncbi:MAG: hypothetical protein PHE68_00840 [Candidatus Peribacteraceae bacterium]|nr:hypothetical protein [Candidatus Peribacteraceae bacterium]MDD5074343.1 hypothetical protein [Candidatus Peribacteraceae bacterium]